MNLTTVDSSGPQYGAHGHHDACQCVSLHIVTVEGASEGPRRHLFVSLGVPIQKELL